MDKVTIHGEIARKLNRSEEEVKEALDNGEKLIK